MSTEIKEHGIPWKVDHTEIINRLIETGVHPTEAILECFQNALDAALPDPTTATLMTSTEVNNLSNRIQIRFHIDNNGCVDNDEGLICEVENDGYDITKDYNHDIFEFINAAKGLSPKRQNPWSRGRKGVGMIQYFVLANKIEVVSQDSDFKNSLYRFHGYWEEQDNGKRQLCWSARPDYTGISEKVQKEYGINHQGSTIRFYHPTEQAKDSLATLKDETIEQILEVFGLIMYRSPNLRVEIDGEVLRIPDFIMNHAEDTIVPELGITGNLYEDPAGVGEIRVYGQGGMKITTELFKPYRRVAGYIVNESLIPDTGRKSVNKDKIWKETYRVISKKIERFPEVKSSSIQSPDKRSRNIISDVINSAIADLVPPSVKVGTENTRPTKEESTGGRRTPDTEDTKIGYIKSGEKKNTKKGKRKKGYKRDIHNKTEIEVEGNLGAVIEGPRINQAEQQHIVTKIVPQDESLQLWDLNTETIPWVLTYNSSNPLFNQKSIGKPKNRGDHSRNTAEQNALVRMEIKHKQGKLPPINTFNEFKQVLEQNTLEALGYWGS